MGHLSWDHKGTTKLWFRSDSRSVLTAPFSRTSWQLSAFWIAPVPWGPASVRLSHSGPASRQPPWWGKWNTTWKIIVPFFSVCKPLVSQLHARPLCHNCCSVLCACQPYTSVSNLPYETRGMPCKPNPGNVDWGTRSTYIQDMGRCWGGWEKGTWLIRWRNVIHKNNWYIWVRGVHHMSSPSLYITESVTQDSALEEHLQVWWTSNIL